MAINTQFENAAEKPEIILPQWLQDDQYTLYDLEEDMKNQNFKYNLDKDTKTAFSAGKTTSYVAKKLLQLYKLAEEIDDASMQHMAAVSFLAIINDANPKLWEKHIEVIAENMDEGTRAGQNAQEILKKIRETRAHEQAGFWQSQRVYAHS